MDSCIFCKIVKGDIPSSAIYEDENVKVLKRLHKELLAKMISKACLMILT